MSYRFADSLRAGSGRSADSLRAGSGRSVLILLAGFMTYTIAVCTVGNAWRWTQELSETCRVLFQNKFEKLVYVVGFILRKYGLCETCEVYTGLLKACEQDQGGVPSWSCSQVVSKPVWHTPLLCVKWKTPDDGQRNCPKHVQFYSKNKFEKLVHLVGFIIRIYHDARSAERQICIIMFSSK